MKSIYIASDHAGFALKAELISFLSQQGYTVIDKGPAILDPEDDYPDHVTPLAREVAHIKDVYGIVIGGSGQGEAMAANRIQGIRASVYYGGSLDIVRLSREHNDSNVLSLGARFLTLQQAQEAVVLWLNTPFSEEARHTRRIAKLDHD